MSKPHFPKTFAVNLNRRHTVAAAMLADWTT